MEVAKQQAELLWESYHNKAILSSFILDQSKKQTDREDRLRISKLTKEQLDLLLTYLRRNKKASTLTIDGKQVVKFSANGIAINDVDIGIVKMEITLETLEAQKVKLLEEIEKCLKDALYFHSKVKKQGQFHQKQALIFLKRKKRLEGILSKRLQAIDNLNQILETIDDARTDQEILEAYKYGTASIKSATAGMTVESVQQVMNDVYDTLADQKEIDEALVANFETAEQDTEMEAELKQLEDELLAERQPITPQSPTEVLSSKMEQTQQNEFLSPQKSSTASPQISPVTDNLSSLSLNSSIRSNNVTSPKATRVQQMLN